MSLSGCNDPTDVMIDFEGFRVRFFGTVEVEGEQAQSASEESITSIGAGAVLDLMRDAQVHLNGEVYDLPTPCRVRIDGKGFWSVA